MKKTLILLLTMVVLSLSSCSSDDPSTPSIVGKWKQTSGVYNPAFFGDTDYYNDNSTLCEQNYITEFREDGTYLVLYCAPEFNPPNTGSVTSGTYIINTTNRTIDGFLYEAGLGTYTISGNTLSMVLTFEDDGTTYTDTRTYTRQE